MAGDHSAATAMCSGHLGRLSEPNDKVPCLCLVYTPVMADRNKNDHSPLQGKLGAKHTVRRGHCRVVGVKGGGQVRPCYLTWGCH